MSPDPTSPSARRAAPDRQQVQIGVGSRPSWSIRTADRRNRRRSPARRLVHWSLTLAPNPANAAGLVRRHRLRAAAVPVRAADDFAEPVARPAALSFGWSLIVAARRLRRPENAAPLQRTSILGRSRWKAVIPARSTLVPTIDSSLKCCRWVMRRQSRAGDGGAINFQGGQIGQPGQRFRPALVIAVSDRSSDVNCGRRRSIPGSRRSQTEPGQHERFNRFQLASLANPVP